MARFSLAPLIAATVALYTSFATAQSPEQAARAQAFFAAHDTSGDGLLTKQEFVDGFIAQSRQEQPMRTAAAMLAYGKERIENCLAIGFDTADVDANGLLAIEELGEAYRQDAFSDLREIC